MDAPEVFQTNGMGPDIVPGEVTADDGFQWMIERPGESLCQTDRSS
jgi:hypothetical protein